MSNGIAKLEERLGDKLFVRSPRGVTQTAFGARILPLIERALVALDAVTAEARRLTEPGERRIRMGLSPLIGSYLVSRSFTVLREANMRDLREGLLAGELDVILIPAVAAMPRFEHQVVDVQPIVVVSPDAAGSAPLELADAGEEEYILVPDTCGLTTFTTRLGLGSAMVPRSRLTSPDVPHRPLVDRGREVRISFEAVWSADSPLAADALRLADGLAAARRTPHPAIYNAYVRIQRDPLPDPVRDA
ncbi:LysR family transcriptional regulator [Streptomyces roseirectus]|uniref:LysR family transcriptional regulator n=1 Tax=Streptomyces roseirectus TaxID=2768066 RepID=A0A7H0I5X0_9ACTN|nr:LysR family transcriptional regulator [Streptomyces roseirectus]QNP68186.1 LysR family transcriptional regulator [Streptomyces roseirectus]